MAFANGDFNIAIPEGYVVVETDRVINTKNLRVFLHFLKRVAERHAAQLNAERRGPLLRWEVERTSPRLRREYGTMARWACVPYQNVLRKEPDE